MTAVTARRCLSLVAVVIACVLPFGSAQAADVNTDNVATATVTQDDAKAFDFAWDIYRQHGDDAVVNRNEADATGQCTRCKATAIAFQIVLVDGSPTPDVVVPQNIAVALNDHCTECAVAAEATQFVRVSEERLAINRQGRAILQDVRRDLAALESQDLTVGEIEAAVEAQEARIREVLATDLVVATDPQASPAFDLRRTLDAADLG